MNGVVAVVKVTPANPSPEFRTAIVEAHDKLHRRGITRITPAAIWEHMADTARMEGTLAHLLAWDKSPDKFCKSHSATIERLIAAEAIEGLRMEYLPNGTGSVYEVLPF